jgi:hypothetical protein
MFPGGEGAGSKRRDTYSGPDLSLAVKRGEFGANTEFLLMDFNGRKVNLDPWDSGGSRPSKSNIAAK